MEKIATSYSTRLQQTVVAHIIGQPFCDHFGELKSVAEEIFNSGGDWRGNAAAVKECDRVGGISVDDRGGHAR